MKIQLGDEYSCQRYLRDVRIHELCHTSRSRVQTLHRLATELFIDVYLRPASSPHPSSSAFIHRTYMPLLISIRIIYPLPSFVRSSLIYNPPSYTIRSRIHTASPSTSQVLLRVTIRHNKDRLVPLPMQSAA